MKVSWHWLRSYVDALPDPESLGDTLTMAGLEVEDVHHRVLLTDGLVVGTVTAVEPHPKADRLQVCRVSVGSAQPLQVICGAPNVAANQRVAVATPGAVVQAGDKRLKIRKTKIRGTVSEGMICAEDEIGLSDDHTGILVLPEDARPGQSLESYLDSLGIPVRDTVYDIAITPNRPDAVCHIGVARDTTACTSADLVFPSIQMPPAGSNAVTVDIACPESCPRYVALLVRNVAIGPSPLWLQQRLLATGHRPINNVVDITNFVMLECGQPLHAFDYDLLEGAHIEVRLAASGERFTTLDGKDRAVPEGTVLICDDRQPVALGGIMGGMNSEVSSSTTNVLLESALFDPARTRRNARAFGLSTDASYRFERGVDPEGQVWAAARAAELMGRYGSGQPEPTVVDCQIRPHNAREVSLRLRRIKRILGTAIPRDEVVRILTALGFASVEDTGSTLRLRVPSYRPDVTQEIDVIEEVARIHGLEALPKLTQLQLASFLPKQRPEDRIRAAARDRLVGRGYREIYTNSLVSIEEAELYKGIEPGIDGEIVKTLNAASTAMTALRPSLLCGMLSVMGHNSRHGQEPLRFWESGHVFRRASVRGAPIAGYAEHESLILGVAGSVHPAGWDHSTRSADFFDLKGDLEALMQALKIQAYAIESDANQSAVTQYHLRIVGQGSPVGIVGKVNKRLTDKHDIRDPVFFAELNWSRLVRMALDSPQGPTAVAINRFPAVRRDVAIVVDKEAPAGPMLDCIREAGSPLIQHVSVFDLFGDQRLGIGNKGMAFSLRLAADRTLTDAEVDAAIENVLAKLRQRFGATLRDT